MVNLQPGSTSKYVCIGGGSEEGREGGGRMEGEGNRGDTERLILVMCSSGECNEQMERGMGLG